MVSKGRLELEGARPRRTQRMSWMWMIALLSGCAPTPPELCRAYARELERLAGRCPGLTVFDPVECEAVRDVRDRASFEADCIPRVAMLECDAPPLEVCIGQLRR